jgi:hypothetical protein
MSEEVEIFQGNRPSDRTEGVEKAKVKAKAHTVYAKANYATTAEHAEALAPEALAETDPFAQEHSEASLAPGPEYHFEIDPESLWTMPPAMQERMSSLSVAAAMTNERLDEQEKAIARVNKALKQLA